MTVDCPREAELLDALASRRWPERVGDELRAHVAACAACADLAVVVGALLSERDVACSDAVALPSADVVWFRAQTRARLEATRIASRPIAIMQAVGLGLVAMALLGAVGVLAARLETFWSAAAGTLFTHWSFDLANLAAGGMPGLVARGTLLAIALWLILAPVAVSLLALED